jgi:hypothetical protein
MIADDVFRDQPVLTGARVRLEPLGSRHFDGLRPMFGETEGSRLTGTHETFTEQQIRTWLATRQSHHDRADWAIVRIADAAGRRRLTRGTASARSATAGSTASPTSGARRSTSIRWCSATRATTRAATA